MQACSTSPGIELAAGEVRMPRPEGVIEVLREAAALGSSTGYTNPDGGPELRSEILDRPGEN